MSNFFTDPALAPTVSISENGYTEKRRNFYVPDSGWLGVRNEKREIFIETYEIRGLTEAAAKAEALSLRSSSDDIQAEARAQSAGAWTVFVTERTEGAWEVDA